MTPAGIARGAEVRMALAGLWRSSFLRNVLLVMSGSAIAQAVGLTLCPVISRLFAPADFGVFGSFSAATGVVLAVVTLDYAQAVMLPKRREEAGQMFLLSCLVTLGMTVLCLLACVLLPGRLLGLLRSQNHWLLVFFVLAVLAGDLNACFQAWCVRVRAFKHTSASQVVRGVASNGLHVAFGSLHTGAIGLIVSSVWADVLASPNLLRVVWTELRGFLAVPAGGS